MGAVLARLAYLLVGDLQAIRRSNPVWIYSPKVLLILRQYLDRSWGTNVSVNFQIDFALTVLRVSAPVLVHNLLDKRTDVRTLTSVMRCFFRNA